MHKCDYQTMISQQTVLYDLIKLEQLVRIIPIIRTMYPWPVSLSFTDNKLL